MRKLIILTAALFVSVAGFSGTENPVKVPKNEDVLKNLYKPHPRLVMRDDQLAELKKRYKTDKKLQMIVDSVLKDADKFLKKNPQIKRTKPRLLDIARKLMKSTYLLGFAWRWTGDDKYAKKAVEDLRVVCKFKDWRPKHFLDTAEMAHAVGIGYDWFYSYLSPQDKQLMRKALLKLALNTKAGEWQCTHRTNNWNVVCNSGLVVGALALAETDPKVAEHTVVRAVKNMPKCLKEFAPDGVWYEGTGYWHYTANYFAYGISAMDSALGTDFGLSKMPGLSKAPDQMIYSMGTTTRFFSFADAGGRRHSCQVPGFFWGAKKYNKPFYAADEMKFVEKYPPKVFHAIWYPDSFKTDRKYTKDIFLRAPVEIATFRTRWNDPKAAWFGIKSGFNSSAHGHLDLGTFEFDANGVRWAGDIGAENYSVPGYWKMGVGGQRWTYYRTQSQSHNVPLIDGKGQYELAKVKFTDFVSKDDYGFGIIDLTPAYKVRGAQSLVRGAKLFGKRKYFLVQDEVELNRDGVYTFGLTTSAKVVIKGKKILLQNNKRTCLIKVLSSSNFTARTAPAKQVKGHKSNKMFRRLEIDVPMKKDVKTTVAILFEPQYDKPEKYDAKITPLAAWK